MEDFPPTDGQDHREKCHLRVCVCVWLNNTVPPPMFMPLICDLEKRAECFPEARIRLFLIKMH